MRTTLLSIACAAMLGVAVAGGARAEGVMFHWPLVPGPSGYLGPVPRGPASTQRNIYVPPQSPTGVTLRQQPDAKRWPVEPGEPDETGRIRPTVRAERDESGKLAPTRQPR